MRFILIFVPYTHRYKPYFLLAASALETLFRYLSVYMLLPIFVYMLVWKLTLWCFSSFLQHIRLYVSSHMIRASVFITDLPLWHFSMSVIYLRVVFVCAFMCMRPEVCSCSIRIVCPVSEHLPAEPVHDISPSLLSGNKGLSPELHLPIQRFTLLSFCAFLY